MQTWVFFGFIFPSFTDIYPLINIVENYVPRPGTVNEVLSLWICFCTVIKSKSCEVTYIQASAGKGYGESASLDTNGSCVFTAVTLAAGIWSLISLQHTELACDRQDKRKRF